MRTQPGSRWGLDVCNITRRHGGVTTPSADVSWPQCHTASPPQAFRILYNFEQVQQFRVEIVDVDRKHDADKVPFHQCNRLGHADFRLSEILTTPERRLTLNMQNTSTKSQVCSHSSGEPFPPAAGSGGQCGAML